jgi:hypothetical protein
LAGGITPVNTNLVFEKFADCLAAEEQMRRHYADAFEAWDRGAVVNFQRRREYARARDLQAKRLLSNVGTCVPHGPVNSSLSPHLNSSPQAHLLSSPPRHKLCRRLSLAPEVNARVSARADAGA